MEDYEMKNFDRKEEERLEQQREEETSFIEDEEEQEWEEEQEMMQYKLTQDYGETSYDDIPNVRKDVGTMRRQMTHDKKKFLRDFLNVNINKNDGPSSKEIFENLKVTFSKNEKVNGATFRDVKVLVMRDGKIDYSQDKTKQDLVNEFKDLIFKAEEEHAETLDGLVEYVVGDNVDERDAEAIRLSVMEKLDNTFIDLEEGIIKEQVSLDSEELREFRGIVGMRVRVDLSTEEGKRLAKEKIENLGIEVDHWKLKALRTTDEKTQKLYETIANVAELKADYLRLKINERPVSEEVQDMVKENDLTRFERFKKWARDNLFGLSAVAISVAGIITAVVISARKVVGKGARATSKFAKAVANLGKKAGALLAPLLSLLANVLSLGAKGIAFLAENLWILAVLIAYFLYDTYVKKHYNKRE